MCTDAASAFVVASRTPGDLANDAATFTGSTEHSATISMSATSSLWRRIEPATSAWATSGCLATLARIIWASIAAAGKRCKCASRLTISIPRRIFSAVFFPNFGNSASCPFCATRSRSSRFWTPSSSWISWIFSGLRPGTRIRSSIPSGIPALS